MGQYHKVYNLDRKEFIHPHKIDCGLKLVEQMGFRGSTADALFLLVANSNGRGGGDVNDHPMIGRWAGDRVVVQGDYSEVNDKAHISDDELENYREISSSVMEMLKITGRKV
jgi:hypothetical protein